MVLRRFTRQIDGTIPVQALLYNDEELLASQDGVGIYDGLQKSRNHQNGIVHVSTHRLFYVDNGDEYLHSFAMDLSYVTQTEYYAGLFKSSPKVTLHVSGDAVSTYIDPQDNTEPGFQSWECEVCAYRNPPGLSPAAARICGLCGVPRASVPVPIKSDPSNHLSSSLPSSTGSSALHSSLSFSSTSNTDSIPCPACTFLNHSSLTSCEICSTPLPPRRRGMKSAPSSRPESPFDDDETGPGVIKISFRKGGDKPFYTLLKRSLKGKAWEATGISSPSRGISSRSATEVMHESQNVGRSGISGILRTVETSAQGRETNLRDSLQDLEALAVKAKDMVRLAAELNERLTAASASTATPRPDMIIPPTAEPEEATFIRSSLAQLGLQIENAPVTLDMIKDERKWFDELARELAQVLQGGTSKGKGMMKERGIIALDEVWGGWNRARGVALVPPSTLLQVAPLLLGFTDPPIRMRTFISGLSVLHTPPYTREAFAARLVGILAMDGPKTTIEIAHTEDTNIGLAGEMIKTAEADGDICRDDGNNLISGGGSGTGIEVRWYVNVFIRYVWDGQV